MLAAIDLAFARRKRATVGCPKVHVRRLSARAIKAALDASTSERACSREKGQRKQQMLAIQERNKRAGANESRSSVGALCYCSSIEPDALSLCGSKRSADALRREFINARRVEQARGGRRQPAVHSPF